MRRKKNFRRYVKVKPHMRKRNNKYILLDDRMIPLEGAVDIKEARHIKDWLLEEDATISNIHIVKIIE